MTLKHLRSMNKISQLKLAEFLNIDQTTVSKWENGKTLLTIDYIPKLSKIFKCSYEVLVNAVLETQKQKEL